jgi:hypothetical protein
MGENKEVGQDERFSAHTIIRFFRIIGLSFAIFLFILVSTQAERSLKHEDFS